MKHFLAVVLLALLPCRAAADADFHSDTWTATDELGRTLPDHAQTGPPRGNRSVGILYHLWHGVHGHDSLEHPDDDAQGVREKPRGRLRSPYDLSEILKGSPRRPAFGPPGAYHHWGEPELGYYLADDEYVIRRHARMLDDAGVDVLVLDVSNGFSYRAIYRSLLDVLARIRAEGGRTPQVAFLAYIDADQVARDIYDDLYAGGDHRDLWYEWRGKPLLLAPPSDLDPELRDFFTVRETWASSRGPWFGDGRDRWTWTDESPQQPGWHDSPDHPEQISVSVAGQPSDNIGRSFRGGVQPQPANQRPGEGFYFQEQWERALEVDPEFILITGWNAWLAQLIPSDGGMNMLGEPVPEGRPVFAEAFNEEFNRDIEPLADRSKDNLYHQMVANIRRFKGTRPAPNPGPAQTISMTGDAEEWSDVLPEFRDPPNDNAGRDHPGWGRIDRYAATEGPNDFVSLRVARDDTNLYFLATTRDPITPPGQAPWMLLFLDVKPDEHTGWHGFQFRVEGGPPADANGVDGATVRFKRTLSEFTGTDWQPVADVDATLQGNLLEIAIPRALVGLDDGPPRLNFKWADAPRGLDHILNLANGGDTAPNRRFTFPYRP